ncbi:hypothetical protein PD5205_01721 [Xanthomonas fragariae]|uniref:Uncharacterized protein n=1 Tax=Xanthomonas fragariae TaxID=48664 RepID=A0A1Y6HHN8_9XANT|nr:hypothetical protein PD5205_01721 [Xanthomonas fragariae]
MSGRPRYEMMFLLRVHDSAFWRRYHKRRRGPVRPRPGANAGGRDGVVLYVVAPEKPQPPNDRKALMSSPACQNYQCSLR